MRSFRLFGAALVAVPMALMPCHAQSAWEAFGLQGTRIVDLSSAGPHLYACVWEDDGGWFGRGIFRRCADDPDSDWVQLGLDGESLWSVWVCPSAPDTIFVGGDPTPGYSSYAVFRSTDGGRSWGRADAGIAESGGLVTGSFQNPSLLLFAGDSWGGPMYRSTNLGEHWEPVTPPHSFTSISFDPQDDSRAWATSTSPFEGGGVLKSEDAGASWAGSIYCFPDPFLDVAIDHSTGRTYVATECDGADILVTDDGGDNWEPVLVGELVRAIDVARWNGNYVIAASGYPAGHAWLSTDAGATWTNYSDGLPAGVLALDVEAHDRNPGVFFAGLSTDGVWRLELEGVVTADSEREAAPGSAIRTMQNPASSEVTFVLSGVTDRSVGLGIFDVAGRPVCLLHRAAGLIEPTYRWDGRDGSGRPVASGMYFAIIDRNGDRLASKFVWLGR
jgi:photosystem II stability/assembly factor-like uncharacterized protein